MRESARKPAAIHIRDDAIHVRDERKFIHDSNHARTSHAAPG
jgi:hypothetical protein